MAAILAAIRSTVGPELFINARCDVWLRAVGEADSRVTEAARRGAIYRSAGADGLFAPGLTDETGIAELVRSADMPLNLLAYPGLPDAERLKALGVRRLSAGSGIVGAALGRAAALTRCFLQDGRSAPLMDGALGWGELNAMMPTPGA